MGPKPLGMLNNVNMVWKGLRKWDKIIYLLVIQMVFRIVKVQARIACWIMDLIIAKGHYSYSEFLQDWISCKENFQCDNRIILLDLLNGVTWVHNGEDHVHVSGKTVWATGSSPRQSGYNSSSSGRFTATCERYQIYLHISCFLCFFLLFYWCASCDFYHHPKQAKLLREDLRVRLPFSWIIRAEHTGKNKEQRLENWQFTLKIESEQLSIVLKNETSTRSEQSRHEYSSKQFTFCHFHLCKMQLLVEYSEPRNPNVVFFDLKHWDLRKKFRNVWWWSFDRMCMVLNLVTTPVALGWLSMILLVKKIISSIPVKVEIYADELDSCILDFGDVVWQHPYVNVFKLVGMDKWSDVKRQGDVVPILVSIG